MPPASPESLGDEGVFQELRFHLDLFSGLSTDGSCSFEFDFVVGNVPAIGQPVLELHCGEGRPKLRVECAVACGLLSVSTFHDSGATQLYEEVVNFSALGYWRFLIVIFPAGNVQVRFFDLPLIEATSELRTSGVLNCRSNVNVKPTLVPDLSDQFLKAIYCSETENLIIWADSSKLNLIEAAIVGPEQVFIGDMFVQQLLGQWPIWVRGTYRPRSEVSAIRFGAWNIPIYEIQSYPAIELSLGHVALRTYSHDTREIVTWSTGDGDELPSSRVALTQNRGGVIGKPKRYFFTPASEILRCLRPIGRMEQALSLRPYENGPLFRMRISAEYLQAIGAILTDISSGLIATKVELQCLVVDLWAWARDEEVFEWIGRTIPVFQSALIGHRELIGEKTPLEVLDHQRTLGSQPEHALSPHDRIIWSSQRAFSEAIEEMKATRESLDMVLRDIREGIDPKVRDWVVLTLSEVALRNGVGGELARVASDEFVWNVLNHPERTWEYSSLTALLASLGEFGTVVSILETISSNADQANLSLVNFSAISASFEALCATRPSLEIREVFLRSFLKLVNLLESREFSRFRSQAIQLALIAYVKLARFDPFWLQNELLSFLENQYTSVPEFWEALKCSLSSEPSSDFVERLYDLATAADSLKVHFESLILLDFVRPERSVEPPTIRAAPVRRRYLEALNSIHQPKDLGKAGEVFEQDNLIVRLLALPPMFLPPTITSGVRPQRVRDCVQSLQSYPRSPYHRLLGDLGSAALNFDFEKILRVLDYFDLIDFRDDSLSKPVVVEVLCWAAMASEASLQQLKKLVEIVEGWVADSAHYQADDVNRVSSLIRLLFGRVSVNLKSIEDKFETLSDEVKWALKSDHPTWLPGSIPRELTKPFFADTIVAVVTCQENLGTHAKNCLETWVSDVQALGVRVVFFCGQVSDSSKINPPFDGELVVLPVGDYYEDLPEKVLAIFDWIHRSTDCAFVVKIDDDCFLDAENFFGSMSYRRSPYYGRPLVAFPKTFDRLWHQGKSKRDVNRRALDCSPLGTTYADGGGSYSLSRCALSALVSVAESNDGIKLRLASLFEDKLIGDLLAQAGFALNSEGYTSAQMRSNLPGGYPVLQVDRTFFPSEFSGISMAHLNGSHKMRQLKNNRRVASLSPPRLFGLDRDVSLAYDSTMLEAIGDSLDISRVREAKHVCVACVRNEVKLLPHFLSHYRKLGFDYFLIVDNLSDDGSREYLLTQSDVAAFSATSDYSSSHFGVDWQRCILDHFCIGKWVLVADVDEFLVTQGVEPVNIQVQCERLEANGFDAAVLAMIDMYPRGDLRHADFSMSDPLSAASCFDSTPVRPWTFNRGPFDNFTSLVSGFRHRILPMAAPHTFTSQKVALFRYSPLMSFSEGFHFGSGMRWSPDPLVFLHFKYSADFVMKAKREVARGQHFANAAEYKLYLQLEQDTELLFWKKGISLDLRDCDGSPLHFIIGQLRV